MGMRIEMEMQKNRLDVVIKCTFPLQLLFYYLWPLFLCTTQT